MTTRATTDNAGELWVHMAETRASTETKSSYKTTELIVYGLAVLGVLIASAIVGDASFGAETTGGGRSPRVPLPRRASSTRRCSLL
jgi:hypothetical protein